jgi:hypothetical protein
MIGQRRTVTVAPMQTATRVRWARRALSLLVFVAIGLGASAAGTPVAGNESLTAVTAGINLSTSAGAHPAPRIAANARDVVRHLDPREPMAVAGLVLLLLRLFTTVTAEGWGGPRSVTSRSSRSRRGPPALL